MAEIIYSYVNWVESLKMRLYCLDHNIGYVRGITFDEFRSLKPAVEALTPDYFALCYPGRPGISKETIEQDIAELKRRFVDFEEHPELLGKDFRFIVHDDGWWNCIMDKTATEFETSNLWGHLWIMQSGSRNR